MGLLIGFLLVIGLAAYLLARGTTRGMRKKQDKRAKPVAVLLFFVYLIVLAAAVIFLLDKFFPFER